MEYERARLGDILREVTESGGAYKGLFFPEGEDLTPEALCAVIRLDEFHPEASIQQIEEETGLSFVLDMDQVREVVLNARAQRADVTEGQLVEALAHYYERDAFLRFEGAQ